jgi:hypothetical protein
MRNLCHLRREPTWSSFCTPQQALRAITYRLNTRGGGIARRSTLPVALGGCGPLEPPGVSVDFRELAAAELTPELCLSQTFCTTDTELSHARLEL